MNQTATLQASKSTIFLNKVKTFFSKPHNVILVLMGIVLTVTTVAPIIAIVEDTFKIHPGTIDAHLTGQAAGYTVVNYIDLFTSRLAKTNLWMPLLNTVLLAVGTCVVAILDERSVPGKRYFKDVKTALPEMRITDDLDDVEAFIRRVKGPNYFQEDGR